REYPEDRGAHPVCTRLQRRVILVARMGSCVDEQKDEEQQTHQRNGDEPDRIVQHVTPLVLLIGHGWQENKTSQEPEACQSTQPFDRHHFSACRRMLECGYGSW